MSIFTTEITSDSLSSDNPIHQRLLKAYYLAQPYVQGELLEIGCGEGRGISLLAPLVSRYVAVDKIGEMLQKLSSKFPEVQFKQMNLPPLSGLEDESFQSVVSFQVIEHIQDDREYLKEIYRVLKPGGKALITTPNINMTLTRNPWHIREYQAHELKQLASEIFAQVEVMGVAGNEKVMQYYEQNKQSVQRITRFDILDLQYRLPASWLKIPYDLLNRLNRRKLQKGNESLVTGITHEDYHLVPDGSKGLDLFAILTK